MKHRIQFPLEADPFFDHTLVVGQDLSLPVEFPEDDLPVYLPHRHREIRKRWSKAWGEALAEELSCLKIAKGIRAILRRLEDWAVATGKYSEKGIGRTFAATALKVREEIADAELLAQHLNKILIGEEWREARRYHTSKGVYLFYLRNMGKMAGNGKDIVRRLLKFMRWEERFTEALSKETESLGLAVSLEPRTP